MVINTACFRGLCSVVGGNWAFGFGARYINRQRGLRHFAGEVLHLVVEGVDTNLIGPKCRVKREGRVGVAAGVEQLQHAVGTLQEHWICRGASEREAARKHTTSGGDRNLRDHPDRIGHHGLDRVGKGVFIIIDTRYFHSDFN